jgi:hypothetical protein
MHTRGFWGRLLQEVINLFDVIETVINKELQLRHMT